MLWAPLLAALLSRSASPTLVRIAKVCRRVSSGLRTNGIRKAKIGLTPPTDCCMSGCANCVWIRYAEQLALLYADRDAAAKETLTSIKDPNLRAFVELELKIKLKQQ